MQQKSLISTKNIHNTYSMFKGHQSLNYIIFFTMNSNFQKISKASKMNLLHNLSNLGYFCKRRRRIYTFFCFVTLSLSWSFKTHIMFLFLKENLT